LYICRRNKSVFYSFFAAKNKLNNMTKQEARDNSFTHRGLMYGFIRVYVKDTEDFEPQITGTNVFYDTLLLLISTVDVALGLSDGFLIDRLEEI